MKNMNPSTSRLEKLKEEHQLIEIGEHIEEYTNYDNIKNPYNFKSWWNSLVAGTDAPYHIRVKIYETALKYLPGSYKLWYHYLKDAREHVMNWEITDKKYTVINDLHERALIYMNKMPRIWIDYCQFLIFQRKVTLTRHAFDMALQSLPVTQHTKIWEVYIDWVKSLPNSSTAICVFKRYLKMNPDGREDFVNYMISIKEFEEAAINIIEILNDDMFYSAQGKTKFDYWLLLCEIIQTYPDKVKNLDCESIIRHGLNKYTDEIGRLWVALCNFYIKLGLFEKARDIFEEALTKVFTARDFSIVFNSYLKFEEELVSKMNMDKENIHMVDDEQEYEEQIMKMIDTSFEQLDVSGIYSGNPQFNTNILSQETQVNAELNVKLLRLTNLIERRPFLLSDALLRQNPHNVKEWLKRIKMCNDHKMIVSTYEKAVKTVDAIKSYGKLELLWINYALYYEKACEDLAKANEIFYRATQASFKKVDQLVSIWCEWAEMHIKYGNYIDAYTIIKAACTTKPTSSLNVTHSLKLWSFYADLEENLGSIENVKSIYNKIMELKIANTQTIFNYCQFLEKNMYFEETFRVYEQAIDFFTWPHAYDIWVVYLQKFTERYKEEKIERARDLFDQVLKTCPKDKIKIFYYMYSDLEEQYGLLNHSIRILDKGCNDVPKDDKPELFSVLIAKTANFFGITKTRTVFGRALEALEPEQILDIGLKYASIERKLGEIDRSRAILIHLSQFCDPSKEENVEAFWKIYEEFELTHGNEDTFQELLRIKRSVAARFSLNAPTFIPEKKAP